MTEGHVRSGHRIVVVVVAVLLVFVATVTTTGEGATYTGHPPISILGNSAFTAANGVVRGQGTPDDPYLIEGWEITPTDAHGIYIWNTNKHFVIRDLWIHDGAYGFSAIFLDGVSNGRIERLLISNVSEGIRISGSANISIDSIELSPTEFYGVTVSTSSSIRIENNKGFSLRFYGVLFSGSENVLIARNSFEMLGAIQTHSVSNATIASNNVTQVVIGWSTNLSVVGNRGGGIEVHDSSNVFVGENVVERGLIGASIIRSRDIAVASNQFGNSGQGLHILDSVNASITGNEFVNNGIWIAGSSVGEYNSHTITSDNLVNGNPILYYKDCNDLAVEGVIVGELIIANCARVRVSNLGVSGTDVGILLAFVEKVTIRGNGLDSNFRGGVVLAKVTSATVTMNRFVGHTWGAATLDDVRDVLLSANHFSNNEVALRSEFSDHVILTHNGFMENREAVRLHRSTNITIRDSLFADNGVGIAIGEQCGIPEGCPPDPTENILISNNLVERNGIGISIQESRQLIIVSENRIRRNSVGIQLFRGVGVLTYRNTFSENKVQATDRWGGRNAWDAGYPVGGNYWSDYTGVDTCSGPSQDFCPDPDGIGDSPIEIETDGKDRYPLVQLISLPFAPPVAAFSLSVISSNGVVRVRANASDTFDVQDPPDRLEVRWDWEHDGWDTTWTLEKVAEHVYTKPGTYVIRLEVRDSQGLTDRTERTVVTDYMPPLLLHEPPAAFVAGQGISIATQATDDGVLDRVVLHYRSSTEDSFIPVVMVSIGNGRYEAAIPAQWAGALEYYIEAWDMSGNKGRDPPMGFRSIPVLSEPRAPPTVPFEFIAVIAAIGGFVAVATFVLVRKKRTFHR